jgi:uncharacterized protein
VEIIGYFSFLLIGAVLGVIGGGGSILTVPVLIFFFALNPMVASAYSLFIVGVTSLIGSTGYIKDGCVDWKMVILFGLPSILAVYFTRAFVLPTLPDHILDIGDFELSKASLILLLFAFLMIASSFSMIRPRKFNNSKVQDSKNILLIMLEGLIVGVLTGLVGAGGGFLVIPAMVVLSGLEMKKAIGTSLVVVAAKSLIGFLGDEISIDLDWTLLIQTTLLSIVGILLGLFIAQKVEAETLKPAFGWFTLVLGIVMIISSIF